MNKKIFIILLISFIMITLILMNVMISYASVSDDLGNLDDYKAGETRDTGQLTTIAGRALGVLQVVGTIVSVIALMLIGIKYMIGSAEQKANYKQTIVPYIIGAAIVFSATALPNIIYKLIK